MLNERTVRNYRALVGQVTLFGNHFPSPTVPTILKSAAQIPPLISKIHTVMDMYIRHITLTCIDQAHSSLFSPSLTLSAVKIKPSRDLSHHSLASTPTPSTGLFTALASRV